MEYEDQILDSFLGEEDGEGDGGGEEFPNDGDDDIEEGDGGEGNDDSLGSEF